MTNDEGYHTYAGFRYWQCADFGVNPEHPPLAKWIAVLPLRLTKTEPPQGPCPVASTVKGTGYGDSDAWLYAVEPATGSARVDRVLPLARRAMLLWPLLLAGTAFLLVHHLFGDGAALAALFLIAFEPTLIAHGALVTTDTAVSACSLMAVAAYYAWQRRGQLRWLLLAGLACGLTLSVKHSGVLILPALLALCLLELYSRRRARKTSSILRQVAAVGLICLLGLAVLWASYHFRYAARPDGAQLTLPLNDFIAQTKAQGNRSIMLVIIPALALLHLLPEAYLYGFVDVLSISNPGQSSFLFGHLYPHGVPWYFPSVVIMKTTLGMLLLGLWALSFALYRRLSLSRSYAYLAAPAVVWMAAGMISTLNIGYRHVLPLIAPVCCLLGVAAHRMWQKHGPVVRVTVVALFVLHAGASLASFPNEIAFGNLMFGGVSNSHNLLTDSNNDWSQALPQLASWLERNNVRECWLAYDGMARPAHSGILCRPFVPNLFGVNGPPPEPAIQTGTFIISGLSQSGIEWERPDLNPYRVFRVTQPRAVVGGADMVYQGTYDLSNEIAVHRIVQATALNAERQYAEALRLAQAATRTMPSSALAHLQMANAFKGLGQRTEANAEYAKALQIAQPQPQWYFLSLPEMRAGEAMTRKLE